MAATTEVREHACWLWSRLGVSLMSLTDRNVWLEEENKRLEQEKSSLSVVVGFFGLAEKKGGEKNTTEPFSEKKNGELMERRMYHHNRSS